jgi:hypothetical protein
MFPTVELAPEDGTYVNFGLQWATLKKNRLPGGWGATPGPLDFIYFLIFTTLPLSHSGSPANLFFQVLKKDEHLITVLLNKGS